MVSLTERDIEILRDLEAAQKNYAACGKPEAWMRPLDCGGSNGSDHSYRLSKLVKNGLAKSRQRSFLRGRRGSKEFRTTDAGLKIAQSESPYS